MDGRVGRRITTVFMRTEFQFGLEKMGTLVMKEDIKLIASLRDSQLLQGAMVFKKGLSKQEKR